MKPVRDIYLKFVYILFLIIIHQNLYAQFLGWSERNTGVTVSLNSVFVESGSFACVCGDSGVVLTTVNYGNTWTQGTGLPNNINLTSIYAYFPSLSATSLVTGNIGTTTYVYRTTNSGLTWTQVFSQPNGHINAVWLNNFGKAFLQGNPVGGRWSLWKSTNYGVTFDSSGLYLPQSGSETGFNNSMWINLSATKIWFGTNNSRIYYSSNYGNNWSVQFTGALTDIFSIWFLGNDMKGFAGSSSMLYTTNGGHNWSVISVPGTGNITGISGQLSEWIKGYVRGNMIYYSIIPSTFFEMQYAAPNGSYNHISFPKTYNGGGQMMAVRNNGGLTRYGYDFVGIKSESNLLPDKFILYQNYPNPFNPRTKIRFSIPPLAPKGEQETRLIVCNSLGQVVKILVNSVMGAGTYEYEWDGSNFASGVYFYFLVVDGRTMDTKKMVLLK